MPITPDDDTQAPTEYFEFGVGNQPREILAVDGVNTFPADLRNKRIEYARIAESYIRRI